MMKIQDPRTIRPGELKSGDVMMQTVVCYIERWDGQILAKIYKAQFPSEETPSIPQGPKVAEISSENSEGFELLRLLFPVVMYAMENTKQE